MSTNQASREKLVKIYTHNRGEADKLCNFGVTLTILKQCKMVNAKHNFTVLCDIGLYPSTSYTFQAFGINVLGAGHYSNSISTTTDGKEAVLSQDPSFCSMNRDRLFTLKKKHVIGLCCSLSIRFGDVE